TAAPQPCGDARTWLYRSRASPILAASLSLMLGTCEKFRPIPSVILNIDITDRIERVFILIKRS
ncbi:MAG: hypothetical protein ACXWOV_17070, partial [Isosphaeraceae bacterium]